ncbi:hypothetical protein ACWEJ6_12150 [Nonomuraea sp. NPDC004702]
MAPDQVARQRLQPGPCAGATLARSGFAEAVRKVGKRESALTQGVPLIDRQAGRGQGIPILLAGLDREDVAEGGLHGGYSPAAIGQDALEDGDEVAAELEGVTGLACELEPCVSDERDGFGRRLPSVELRFPVARPAVGAQRREHTVHMRQARAQDLLRLRLQALLGRVISCIGRGTICMRLVGPAPAEMRLRS